MELAIILAILDVAMEKGIPAVLESVSGWDKEKITLEDVQSLKTAIKPPEDYN